MSNDQGISAAATRPTICTIVEAPGLFHRIAHTPVVTLANMIHRRSVKTWPALMRFFQSSATAGGPTERNKKGARLLFGFVFVPCQFPDRIAATLSAILLAFSTEASSNATFERMTHQ